MPVIKPVRYIVFDLDGTLVDTAQDLADALTHAVAFYEGGGGHGPFEGGHGPFGPEDVKPLVGEGLERLIRKALGPDADESDLDTALRRFVEYYRIHLTEHSRPYDGVYETLRQLALNSSITLAVLSNKRTEMCKSILRDLGLDNYFKVVVGGDLPSMKKPHPSSMGHVLEQLGAKPEECVMVGDSDLDVETAHNVGAKSIAVTYGFRPPESLQKADHLVNSFPEVLDALRSMGLDVPR